MSTKILSVDDSKAVRIIVKRALNPYDVTVVEAVDGQQGLLMASNENPDLILLDVTMPVMDGVQMLTKLKENPKLKDIPVVMLTAEAGKENVMKIAKLGIRDYIVKPFEEENLIEKVGRIVSLKEKTSAIKKQKTIDDPCTIVFIDDKEAIIKQAQSGLAHTPWKIEGSDNPLTAIEKYKNSPPDAFIISLSYPEHQAINFFRTLRSITNTKEVPVLGLAIKTATSEQKEATDAGFTGVFNKPIDYTELTDRLIKILKLDTSSRYFKSEENILHIKIPEVINSYVINDLMTYLQPKIIESVDNGFLKTVFDLRTVEEINLECIKFIIEAMKKCDDIGLPHALVVTDEIVRQFGNFSETEGWSYYKSLEEAKNHSPAMA